MGENYSRRKLVGNKCSGEKLTGNNVLRGRFQGIMCGEETCRE